MSRADYQAIAAAIYEQREYRMASEPVQTALDGLVERLVLVMGEDNPRFDRNRFIEACETGSCKGMKRRVVA